MSMSTQEIMHGRTVDWTIEKQHNIKVGDIFYNSWGWEQTNIDYYQVIAVTKKMISIQQLESSVTEYNECFMTGKVIPKKNSSTSEEVLKKKPYYYDGSWRINFEHGTGKLWDGNPMDFSCYA